MNIILFGQDGNDIIECDSNRSKSPIYLESVPENKLFISLHWKNEPFTTFFSKIPTLQEKQLTRYGVGHVHLQISNCGSSYLYLRAQRFNPTTVVTHTTDLYNIYKDS